MPSPIMVIAWTWILVYQTFAETCQVLISVVIIQINSWLDFLVISNKPISSPE